MAEGWSSAAGNAALEDLVATYPWVQLHTAAPGAAGTNAVAGNATRKQATWGSASAGSIATSADLLWDSEEVTTTEQYTHFTMWSAETSGTFGASGTVNANAVTSGDEFKIAAGGLTLSIDLAS